ncbi:hypothetical protein Cgig2_004640 [Carnegiea gigantea]|uniref:Uncharacterized protein n=1 Tax=Carnegiea gigantea TaxID=171969 RepID=A0A9Q1QCN2_9CARY|nr:hypothetical protein Cgig2_004640 [Carnegiea gigantea]
MIDILTSFKHYLSIGVQKQTRCILLKARHLYLSLTSTVFSCYHYKGLFTMKGLRTQSVLEGALVGTHVSLTNLTRLLDYDKLLRIDFAYFLSICLTSISYCCEDNLDVLVRLDFNELPDLESTFHYHHMLICYRIGSQVMPFTQEKFNSCISRVMVSNAISKDEGTHGFKPKLKIFRVGKPLEPFALVIEDNPSYIKILRIDVTIRAVSIYFVLDRAINEDDKLHIGACDTSFKKEEIDDVKFKGKIERCFSLNNDEAESTPKPMLHWCPIHHIRIPLKCSIKPFQITYFVLPSLKGDFNSFCAINFQRGINVNPLEKNQKKDLSSQVTASDHLPQETNCEVFDLQSQIDITNATEIIDPSTKAILEKTKAYIKESFKDLRNF